jgi:hypothetical protein
VWGQETPDLLGFADRLAVLVHHQFALGHQVRQNVEQGATVAATVQVPTLYMVKAVMNGRADEVVDLAVTNLWR